MNELNPSRVAPDQPRIACLAWGSLLWKSGALRLASDWKPDGPSLPIEFARVGDHGELATALCETTIVSPTHWALVDAQTLEQASEMLRQREEIPPGRIDGIGHLVVSESIRQRHGPVIEPWARAKGLDAVIWTALPPRYAAEEGRIPSKQEAIAYLSSLTGPTLEHAREYVRKVPSRIETPNRAAIREALGW